MKPWPSPLMSHLPPIHPGAIPPVTGAPSGARRYPANTPPTTCAGSVSLPRSPPPFHVSLKHVTNGTTKEGTPLKVSRRHTPSDRSNPREGVFGKEHTLECATCARIVKVACDDLLFLGSLTISCSLWFGSQSSVLVVVASRQLDRRTNQTVLPDGERRRCQPWEFFEASCLVRLVEEVFSEFAHSSPLTFCALNGRSVAQQCSVARTSVHLGCCSVVSPLLAQHVDYGHWCSHFS